MQRRLPLLIRAFLAVDLIRDRAVRLWTALRDEVLWAWTNPPGRDAANQLIHGRSASFRPGGNTFEGGLFDWEQRAIGEPPFPPAGRILLGGAGGGREIAQLCGRGYEVVAFEPSEALFDAARKVASAHPAGAAVRASYADLVTAADRQSGPLAPHVLGPRFDAVVLGWGSFSYVFTESDRVQLFRAIRKIAPAAPVLLSFLVNSDREGGRLDHLRLLIRRTFRLLGAPSTRSAGDVFLPIAGFSHLLTEEELKAAAESGGYRILYYRICPYSHAMLLPQ